jgi:uncharacterized protein YkwD
MFRRTRTLAATALVAVSLVGVPDARAAVCPHSHAAAADAGRSGVTRATLCFINVVRSRHGLSTLRLSSRLSSAARRHSRDMVRRGYFAHSTPEGSTPADRIRATGYLSGPRRWLVGETLAWWRGSATPATIVVAWMHSPPHRKVLLDPVFRKVGIGVVLGTPPAPGRGGATYTADFGARF